MNGSGKFNLNVAEAQQWAKNVLIFASPLLILALTQFQATGKVDTMLLVGAFVQALIDLLKKFATDNTKRVF